MDTLRSDPLLLTIVDAARRLGIGRSKFYELISDGEIEVVKIGRCARVPAEAVEQYVSRLRLSHRPGSLQIAPRQAGARRKSSARPLVSLFDAEEP